MEQCTSCGSYRARDAEGLPYVVLDSQNERQDDGGLPDPESNDDGSVWGPD